MVKLPVALPKAVLSAEYFTPGPDIDSESVMKAEVLNRSRGWIGADAVAVVSPGTGMPVALSV